MAQGDTITEIVESPLTSGKILTAINLVLGATSTSGILLMESFNQGRSMVISSTVR